MTINHVISNFAVLAVIAGAASHDAMGAIRAGNKSRSYADAYNQLNEISTPRVSVSGNVASANNTTTNDTTSADVSNLPIRVANAGLADRIARGDASAGVTIDDLSRCGMVYPGGEFAWDKPTAGVGRGGSPTCVAVVEMRAVGAATDGSDLVLARANVASGSSVRCNISEFPEIDYTSAISDFVFPADNPPTMDDVVKVLNAEQKQNAGLKIAAGAVIGAIGGNIAGKNDVGKDGLLGTDKGKVQGSIIGALSGAAITAGGAFGGKVGGDVIMSTGVNAAAGGIIGNVLASGDSVLRIEDCEIEHRKTTCLWGYVMDSTPIDTANNTIYFNITDGETAYVCDARSNNCKVANLVNIRLTAYPDKDIHEASATRFNLIVEDTAKQFQLTTAADGTLQMEPSGAASGTKKDDSIYAQVVSAGNMGKQYPAMIPDVKDSTFGLKSSDWSNLRKKLISSNKTPVGRGVNGKQTAGSKSYTVENFYPIYRSAEDGGIVDFGNKARLKATMTGAGVGGALGAFSGYQGAQSDISDRWLSATREYEDSLTRVYCITGSRYLTQYNDVVTILEMP
ncbi:MAG: hypothetical protein K2M34_02250 [Alphaproteobacteria bacterium]|nr:hypothetical protein [Alphaproteobacteria bacterium]